MKNQFQFTMSCLATGMLVLAGCQKSSDNPQPKPAASAPAPQSDGKDKTASTEQDTNKQEQAQGSEGQQTTSANKTQTSEAQNNAPAVPTPSVPVPTAPIENRDTIASVIQPDDDTTILFTKFLRENRADQIERTSDQLLDEVYKDEGQAPGKRLELEATVAKLQNHGLYTPEVRKRVMFLQNRIEDRRVDKNYASAVSYGAFIVGSSLAIGTLSATGAFKHVPEIPAYTQAWAQRGQAAAREKMHEFRVKWHEGLDKFNRTVRDRQNLNAAVDRTRQSIVSGTTRFAEAVKSPFRGADAIVRENLADFGITAEQEQAIGTLSPTRVIDLPVTADFKPTPKSTFQYAVLDRANDEVPLTNEKIIAFKQQRLAAGSPFENIFVSQPMPSETADAIVAQIAAREAAPLERQFVHFVNFKTGAVSAMRWPVTKFKKMMQDAGVRIRPLFANFDTPTFAGTTASSAGLMAVLYWWGFENGQNDVQNYQSVNLERLIQNKDNLPPFQTSEMESAAK
jgi:hypothetical protein